MQCIKIKLRLPLLVRARLEKAESSEEYVDFYWKFEHTKETEDTIKKKRREEDALSTSTRGLLARRIQTIIPKMQEMIMMRKFLILCLRRDILKRIKVYL